MDGQARGIGRRGISRREFLGAANAAALLLVLESCSLGAVARKVAGPTVPSGGTPYQQSLELLLESVRSSPDHLALRAEDAVAAKDATAIVEFVRDRVGVLPPFSLEDARSARRWGQAATLRGGEGTLRERADLLADMLTRAGFKASVQEADRPASVTVERLYAPRRVPFAPDQTRVDLAKQILGRSGVAVPSPPAQFRPPSDPVADLLGVLPASVQQARVRDGLLPDRIPVVSFDDQGKTRYAFAIGSPAVSDTAPANVHPTSDADAIRSVAITVSAVSSPALGSSTPSGRLIDLVSARWPLDQAAGRQVLVTFPPLQGPKALLQSSLGALPVRVPTLKVQAPAAAGAAANLAAGGSPITVQGDVLQPSGGGAAAPVQGPYGPLTQLSDADRRRLVGSVRSLRATANASAFPEVELEVSAIDASGAPVDGLDAAAFSVAEEGKTAGGFVLLSNAAAQRRPRVLVVYDAPFADMWPSPAAKSAFDANLVSALAALAAKTPFDVQVVSLGAQPAVGGWSPPAPAAMSTQIAAASEAADDPWRTAGGDALDQGVTAIVMVSDMDPLDADPVRVPTLQRRLVASKVPVFCVPVGQFDQATLSHLVTLSGGAQFSPASAPAQIAAGLAPLLASWTGGGYRLRYQAPSDGPAQRTVTVGLAGDPSRTAGAAYSVPSAPVPPPSFSGLYVRIEIPGVLSAFRRIAGVEATSLGRVLGPVDDPKAIAEVRAALDGITTIAIEPGGTTAAALLDDLLSAQLSIEPVRALKSARADDLLNAVKAGVRRLPVALAAMLQPAPASGGAVQSLRCAILQERSLDGSTIETHADFSVGANPVIPVTADARAAFAAALTTSTAQSVVEASIFDDSAFGRLSGRPLRAITNGDYTSLSAFLASVPAGKLSAWKAVTTLYDGYHVAVPVGGAVDAMWVVDPATGAAKAVLLDSTGGAMIRSCEGDTGELAMATMLALLAIACVFLDKVIPYECLGINVSASAMCVVQLFDGSADFTTIPALWLTWKPLPGGPWGNASVGFMLLYLSLAVANCI